MPEEAELHPIPAGMPRQSSPSAGAAGKLTRYRRGLLFARRHSSRGRQPRRRGFRGKSRRASRSVGHPAPQLDWRGDDFKECPRQRPARCRDAAAGLARPRCDVDAADLDHLLQPASKPSPSTGESEELNYRLLAPKAGPTRKPSEKGLCNFSSCCTPYCVKKTVGHKILTEITRASHERAGQRQASGVTDERGVLIEPQLREGPLGDRKRRVTSRLCRDLPPSLGLFGGASVAVKRPNTLDGAALGLSVP
jgi:hypothetical protein